MVSAPQLQFFEGCSDNPLFEKSARIGTDNTGVERIDTLADQDKAVGTDRRRCTDEGSKIP